MLVYPIFKNLEKCTKKLLQERKPFVIAAAVIVLIFVFLNLAIAEETLDNNVSLFGYTYEYKDNSYKFRPLQKDFYKKMPKEARQGYKQVKYADKMWKKGQKYSENDKRRYQYFEKAFRLNPSLLPVATSLGLYYYKQKNYQRAIYYISKVPVIFDKTRDLRLSMIYSSSGKYNDAINTAKEFLKQEDISEKLAITANYIIMNSYFSSYKYDEALKYADILIDKYNSCHDYQSQAWNTRYYCYLHKKDYKNALDTAIQMAKIWGYKDHFNKIKLCTNDTQTRIDSYNIVRDDHLRRGNNDRVIYINSLIAEERRQAETVQQQQASDGYWDYLNAIVSLRQEGCVDVTKSDNGTFCVYPATIVSKTKYSYPGEKVYREFWAESVFYPVEDDIYRTKQYYIVDCSNRLYAGIDYIDYGSYDGTKAMSNGSKSGYRYSPEPNRHIPPNSVIEGIFNFVCKYSK